MTLIQGYPTKGEEILIEVIQKRGIKQVRGRWMGKVFTVRSGAVMAEIECPSQVIPGETYKKTVPWTSDKDKVKFYRLPGNSLIDHPRRSS